MLAGTSCHIGHLLFVFLLGREWRLWTSNGLNGWYQQKQRQPGCLIWRFTCCKRTLQASWSIPHYRYQFALPSCCQNLLILFVCIMLVLQDNSSLPASSLLLVCLVALLLTYIYYSILLVRVLYSCELPNLQLIAACYCGLLLGLL